MTIVVLFTISYFVSRIGSDEGWREDARTYHDAAALELGTTVLSSVLEGLRPILEALEGEDQARFVDAYKPALREAYPAGLYPFPRLFVVARA